MRPLTSHIDGGVCARCRTTAGAVAVRRCALPRAAAGAPPAGKSARQRECDAWRSRCEEVHTESTSATDQRNVVGDLVVDGYVEATSGSGWSSGSRQVVPAGQRSGQIEHLRTPRWWGTAD